MAALAWRPHTLPGFNATPANAKIIEILGLSWESILWPRQAVLPLGRG